MNERVIAIEEARAKLTDAIDAADGRRRPARAAHAASHGRSLTGLGARLHCCPIQPHRPR